MHNGLNNYFFKNEISVKEVKNKKYYLPKRNYIFKISSAKNSSEQQFTIK